MDTKYDWLQLCDDIDDGHWDAGLDALMKAAASRKDIVLRRNARRMQRQLVVGARVRLTNGMKPRYMEGMVGTIQELRAEAAVVLLDKLPVQTGAGRPSEATKSRVFQVPFENLVLLGNGEDIPLAKDIDLSADIGDDNDYEAEEDDDIEELIEIDD